MNNMTVCMQYVYSYNKTMFYIHVIYTNSSNSCIYVLRHITRNNSDSFSFSIFLGSLCDRFFTNCDERYCAVQSPNYPGMYPRHITCHYILRQSRYVSYSRPLISVLQKNRLKFNVKDRSALPSQGVFPTGLQVS